MYTKKQVEEANKIFHSAFAEKYNKDNQHILGDNFNRVTNDIKSIIVNVESDRLVDFGSGTGFILIVAKGMFKELVAVDFTEKIIKNIPEELNVKKYIENTENTSIKSNSADIVTAYSFLHHLYELQPTLKEAYRILKPDGVFYSGLDPNKLYWNYLKNYHDVSENAILERELRVVLKIPDIMAKEGIDADITNASEYQKQVKGGFDPEKLIDCFREIGFRKTKVRFDWFLGQAFAKENYGMDMVLFFEKHLRDCLPATAHLFKYLTVFAWK